MTTGNPMLDQIVTDAARRIYVEVAAGRMTEAEAEALVVGTILKGSIPTAQVASALTTAQNLPRDERNDVEVAAAALQHEGMTRSAALEAVAAQGTAAFAQQIAAERQREEQRLTAEAERAYANSPDGRREAAATALAAQEQLAKDARLARAWLVEHQGIDAESAASLTDAEAVGFAFSPPPPADTLQANLDAIAAMEGGESS